MANSTVDFIDKTNDQIKELVWFAKRFCSDQELSLNFKIGNFPAKCDRNKTFEKIANHTFNFYHRRGTKVICGDKEILIVIEDFNSIKITNNA